MLKFGDFPIFYPQKEFSNPFLERILDAQKRGDQKTVDCLCCDLRRDKDGIDHGCPFRHSEIKEKCPYK